MSEQEGARPIQVRLACVGEWVPEQRVLVLDISEDAQGRDVLAFRCPECGREHESLRVGR